MASARRRILVVDSSDHRRAGGWFLDCLAGFPQPEIKRREEIDPRELEWRAVILSGSEHSIFEDNDWLDKQLAFVRNLLAEGVPLLGVCFGHQLIFRALYGKDVLTRRVVPDVGWLPVRLTRHAVFEGAGETIRPYNFHFEEVAEVPGEWEVLASSETCRVQAARHTELAALGLQFHPEIGPEEGASGILRERQYLAVFGLDADAIVADASRGGRHYPEIIRGFVVHYGGEPSEIA
jgi:GMP synthase-like glutamine amidotransferase